MKAKPKSKLLDAEVSDPGAAFERFRKLGRNLLAVPKKAIQQKLSGVAPRRAGR